MPAINNLDYLNLNALRSYPVKEGTSRISTDGIFTIPDDFLVEASLAATSDVARKFFISRILNYVDVIVVEFSDSLLNPLGSISILAADHIPYKEYYLTPVPDYAGANGRFTVCRLTGINNQPTGSYTFNLATTELESRTVIPSITTVNRVTFRNFSGSSFTVTGDVSIIARSNVKFEYSGGSIFIDAGDNLGLNKLCSEDTAAIKTINGISPDSGGNFTLDFSDCITLTPISSNTGLTLHDVCCKPCTGCSDLEELTNRLTTAESDLIKIRDYYTNLVNIFDSYKISVATICAC